MRRAALPLALLLSVVLAPAAVSQDQDSIRINVTLEPGLQLVSRAGQITDANFLFRYQDVSIESATPLTPQGDLHQVSFSVVFASQEPPEGWQLSPPTPPITSTRAGESGTGTFVVQHSPSVPGAGVQGFLVAKIEGSNVPGEQTVQIPWSVVIAPEPAAQIDLLGGSESVRPYGTAMFQVSVRNVDAYPATFRISATVLPGDGIDPANVQVFGTGDRTLQAGETEVVTLGVVAPRAKFWYNDVFMGIRIEVVPVAGGSTMSVTHFVAVDGFYVHENIYLLLIVAIAQIILLVWLIVFARRRYERRYLGRPVPPWEVPEEAVRLEALKREDPRAHYVLRYFLMEEEYRSALLWFFAYKKISKKKLKAEIRAIELREKADELVSLPAERFEKASARIQRRYARRMENAQLRTQKRLDRLQAKLERTYEKDFEKDHEKWEEKVEKLQKKHNKPYVKAKAKWDKQTKKILEKWEKPFAKDKKKYEAKLAKAKEAYAKKVKKQDKDVWRAWREQMDDWEQENKVRKKEGREPAPEPELFSAKVGPPELPPPFEEPPRPELPPEPQPEKIIDVPPEPQLTTPDLMASHYAKKAKKAQKEGARDVRKLELKLAEKLNGLRHKRDEAGVKVEEKREKLIAESQTVTTRSSTFVDRVLRRSSDDVARRHHVSYLRGLTRERIQEVQEAEEAQIERVRIQGARAEADLESKILRERAELRKANKLGTSDERASESARVAALVRELGEVKIQNAKRLDEERKASKARLEAAIQRLKAEEAERIRRAEERPAAAPPAEAAKA